MTRAFISALGGMHANQDWMDVIGNNLANSNTLGYKSARALFSDQLSATLNPARGPGANSGGINPQQVGMGTVLSSIDRNQTQGALSVTGRTFDLALSGEGFFGLQVGTNTFYTRVGTFALDANSDMTDLRTGYRVLGTDGLPINVNMSDVFPPKATSSLDFAGNLPSEVTGPLAEQLTSSTPMQSGTPASLASTGAGPFPVPIGETYTFDLTMNDGSGQEVAVTSTTGTISAQDVVDAINGLDHVSASLGAGGVIDMQSDVKGVKSSIKVTPGEAGKDLASLVGLGTSLVTGAETSASVATDLNSLTANTKPYVVGDTVEFSGSDADGTPLAASFVYGTDGTTVGDLATFLNNQYAGATVAFNPTSQQMELDADATGEASLSLVLLDGANQTGSSNWTDHVMTLTTNGQGPDTATSSVEVFDASGTAHQLTFQYERQEDGTWKLEVDLPPEEGTVTAGTINGILFDSDGSILSPPAGSVTVQFTGQAPQSISLAFGAPGSFSGVTQFGGSASVLASGQDGYGAGELATMDVLKDGTIQGFYTNGQTTEMGNFGVATFANQGGLQEVGDSLWEETANSGDIVFGSGFTGAAGEIVGGALEESNVDTAEEFVRLIQAQRGFQSNARVISVQDEMMSEANNML
jgi:flagellar hook protein FlgE